MSGITKYRCITVDDKEIIGVTPTWFGEPLPSYMEIQCPKCGVPYSLDIVRSVREREDYCSKCLEPIPTFRYIEEVKE